jgi:N-methylhydantoinase A
MIIGVNERILADGSVRKPIEKNSIEQIREFCQKQDAESIAICFLHSYANPVHEEFVKSELSSIAVPVTISSEILPEFREYERLSTTVINAYLAPVIGRYLEKLAHELGHRKFFVQLSGGGLMPSADVAKQAVQTILSGPAGGVQGAFQVMAQLGGENKIITFDMGGTSTDVSLCDNALSYTCDYRIDNFPIRNRVIDIKTVGAGGGSLAWVDPGGLLRVGPESAGALPGPICYGKGEQLTVTDANLFLGRLLPDFFLGGKMKLTRDKVAEKMQELGNQLGLSPAETALGIIRIVTVEMVRALRAVSLEKGYDPREFTLFGFGGAAGLHCCEIASELNIAKILIPARAGILSAQGMVMADPAIELAESVFLKGDKVNYGIIEPYFAALEQKGRARVSALSIKGELVFERVLELRYLGQSYELSVPFTQEFVSDFHNLHEQNFGYCLTETPLELISIRLIAKIIRSKYKLPKAKKKAKDKPKEERQVVIHFEKGETVIPVFFRSNLEYGHHIQGPALIADNYTTVLLTPGYNLDVDQFLNLSIKVEKS